MNRINKSIPKVDSKAIVTGKPVYTDDLFDLNTLIIKVLRSPIAFGRIKSINKDEALKLSGVECVLTYEDVPRIPFTRAGQAYPEGSAYDKYILDEYVRFVGDDVAIVAARDEKTAEKALKLIKVEYEEYTPVLDFENAIDNPSIIHSKVHTVQEFGVEEKRNIAAKVDISCGNVDDALKECSIIVRDRFYTKANSQAMMETFRSGAYIDDKERLVIVTATQIPFHIRRFVARALNIPQSKVRVTKPRTGGGFGAKQTANTEFYPAIVTYITGKPSKIVYTREETFECGSPRHPMRLDVTIGASNDGKIKVIDIEGLSDTGAYGEHAYAVFLQAGMKSLGMYNKCDAVRFKGNVVYTNKVPTGAFRGYGATQGIFALEGAINKLSHKLNIDPTVIREINMIKEGEKAIRFNFNGFENKGPFEIMESCGLDKCIKRGKELIDWDNKKKLYKSLAYGSKKRGLGMAIARQGSGIANVDMGSCILILNDGGFFNMLIGATDIGTGSDTILAQIAAEELNVEFENISVTSSDTSVTPYDGGAYASSTTYVTGNAVKNAAKEMKEKILVEASKILCQNVDSLYIENGEVKVKGYEKGITIKEITEKISYSGVQLISGGSYKAHKSPPPYMAGFCEVEVDEITGEIKIIEFVGVLDIGTVINPNLAKVQGEGGILQGISMALYEDVQYTSKGKMITNNFLSYTMPRRGDVGKITVDFVESYEPTGPFGAKSVGEVVVNSSSPAIVDAIYDAIGVRINDLPITPQKIIDKLIGI
ncbi:MAG: molybdopterin cofactor-binding domain-containing protein [Clostridium sp.]